MLLANEHLMAFIGYDGDEPSFNDAHEKFYTLLDRIYRSDEDLAAEIYEVGANYAMQYGLVMYQAGLRQGWKNHEEVTADEE